jgi:hypothetical protein
VIGVSRIKSTARRKNMPEDTAPRGNDFDHMVDGVTEAPRIHDGVHKLIHNIADKFRSVASHEETVRATADLLAARAEDLAKHVMANTPMIVGTHAAPERGRGDRDEDDRSGRLGPGERWMPEGGEEAGLKETHGHGDELGPGERYATAAEDKAADKKAGVHKHK